MDATARGSIIVLNGPSSAGKTTLARAVRDARAPNAAAVSIDDLMPFVSRERKLDWHLFAALTAATFAAAGALARSGLDVLVDTVFERPDCLTLATAAFAGLDYRLVGVTCAVEVLEAREKSRGDRRLGQAREQHGRVLNDLPFDLVLDTSVLSIPECVERIVALLS